MSERNKTRPKTRMEAKIWNRYTSYNKSWDFIPITHWPNNLAEATIQKRLKSKDRMQMFIYFVGNGMSPREAREVMLEMGEDYFDKSAIDNIYYLEKNIVQLSKKYDYWDEILAKRVLLGDTLVIEGEYSGRYKYHTPQRVNINNEVVRFDDEEEESAIDEFDDVVNENPFAMKCKIEEMNGDLFNATREWTLVHCVAKDARMGTGIARGFRLKYPDIIIYRL